MVLHIEPHETINKPIVRMNYGNDSNNTNQHEYSNNVPRPTFSGVLGTGRPEERPQPNERNSYITQAQFSPIPYQQQNGYPSEFQGYNNNYNNYHNVDNQGILYNQLPQHLINNQFNNDACASQYNNHGTSWSYNDTRNAMIYNNPNTYNVNSKDESSKEIVSYEDIAPVVPTNIKKKNNKKKLQHKQQNNINHNNNGESDGPKVTVPPIPDSTCASSSLNDDSKVEKLNNLKNMAKETLISKGDTFPGSLRLTSQNDDDDDDNDDHSQSLTSKSNINIPGTSIKLDTDEEIKKWKEERRKMWLLKISNNKEEHMKAMGVKENDLKNTSVLKEASKQKKFIQSIESQVHRYDPKANLNLKVAQREMATENDKILQFIQELGDANLLKYELTAAEKEKLFGSGPTNFKRKFKNSQPYGRVQKKKFNNNQRYDSSSK